jgi:hypothetical protein
VYTFFAVFGFSFSVFLCLSAFVCDTLAQLFNSVWEEYIFVTDQLKHLAYVETNTPKYSSAHIWR